MTFLQVLIIILFLISIGSMNMHRAKNSNSMSGGSGHILLTLLPLLSIVFLVITISNIANLKWYWSILISVVSVFLLSGLFAKIYSSIFGYKTKPVLSLEAGGYIRQNVNIIDSLITFCLGLLLFFLS